jgi:hypothetical protein
MHTILADMDLAAKWYVLRQSEHNNAHCYFAMY